MPLIKAQSIKIFGDLTLLFVILQSATQQAQGVKRTSSEHLRRSGDFRSTSHARWLRAPLHTLVFTSLHHKVFFACLDEKHENFFYCIIDRFQIKISIRAE